MFLQIVDHILLLLVIPYIIYIVADIYYSLSDGRSKEQLEIILVNHADVLKAHDNELHNLHKR